jgi:hypothetical protein
MSERLAKCTAPALLDTTVVYLGPSEPASRGGLSRADYDADYLKELDRRSQIVYGIDFKPDSE